MKLAIYSMMNHLGVNDELCGDGAGIYMAGVRQKELAEVERSKLTYCRELPLIDRE